MTKQNMKLLAVLCLILLINPPRLFSQIKHIGIPEIKYYNRHSYEAGTQNWSITQDEHGVLYIGNNQGMLSFDGTHWNLFTLENHSVCRSIAYDGSDKIYLGGYNSIGYLMTNSEGQRKYVDITEKVPPKNKDFGEVWRIHVTENGVLYQTYSALLLYHNDKLSVLADNEDFHYSFYINKVLYLSHRTKGLLRFNGQDFIPVTKGDFFKNDRKIWTMLPHEDISYLIGTQDKGLYVYTEGRIKPWKSDANEFLKKNQLFSAVKLSETHYAFGSIQNGLIITNNSGEIVQHINKESGLANNTVLSMKIDQWGNLWCGLDNGINYIEVHSPITYLDEGRKIEGTGYTSAICNNKLYLGTNQGVYFNGWSKKGLKQHSSRNYKLIKKLKGQAWKLKTIDNRVFCGHNKGTFIIKDQNIRQITGIEGGWDYLRVPGNDSLIIAGTYSGLLKLQKNGHHWEFAGRIKGFNESCRDIFFDKHGDLWMNHGYLGVFRLHLSSSFDSVLSITEMGKEHGINTPTEYYLFNLNNKVYHSNYDSIFVFNYLANQFEYSEEITNKFDGQGINRLKVDKFRNIWYFGRNKNEVNVVLNDNGPWNKENFEVLNKLDDRFINAFEHVHVIDPQNILLGIEKGFAHLNPNMSHQNQKKFESLITCVEAYSKKDTITKFCSRKSETTEQIEFPPKTNSIRFNFSAAFYEGMENIRYKLILHGPDNTFRTGWINNNYRDFSNLEYGDYSFELSAKNVYGAESSPVAYHFTIETPWHQTSWAYTIYTLLALVSIYFAFTYIDKRFERERAKDEEAKKEEIRAKEGQRKQEAIVFENKIIQLKNDKLKADVARKVSDMELKNKELASFAVQINHKNEILGHMKKELDKVSERVNDQAKTQIRHLTKKIDEDIKLDRDWEQFKIHFDRVQQGFIKNMQDEHPNLKPNDLKLCAFLRMNLSTKEIAPLMNISIRGVEIHRYRLRKKLGLERQTNLVEFLMQQ